MKQNFAIRVLEFLNFVEDDRPRLSWTRIAFVTMLGLAVYTILKTVGAGEAATISGSVVAAVAALSTGANYIHQRMAWYGKPDRVEERPSAIGFHQSHGEQPDDPDRN